MENPHTKRYLEKVGGIYKEPHRPQYHFSPKTEWMNDINALWYQNGTYHMLYQWGASIRHGGYATSKDLLHWEDKGVALVPGKSFLIQKQGAKQNVAGDQVYSGSGIVVSGETAKKITGSSKEALIAFYTGTAVGTCIAWSNDEGATWHNYPGNPVANPTTGADPRDPCVFWHEASQSWILAIFERGTTFYGSKDLLEWEKLSTLGFGYECPDVYPLPLDGDPDKMKWVVSDANGWYLVGQFDGKEFKKEQEYKRMDIGPDFYAGQCFYPQNMPGNTYVQIAWMDHWNGGAGESGWQRNATFPVELNLITYKGEMVVTRTPIPAIQNLYTTSRTWKNLRLDSSSVKGLQDPLEEMRSKTFDLELVIDAGKSTALETLLYLNGYPFRYLNQEQALIVDVLDEHPRARDFSQRKVPLAPDDNGKVTLRFLVDHATIELFVNGGVFSWTKHFARNVQDDTLDLQAAGGEVVLDKVEFHSIRSIWQTAESSAE